MAASKNAVRDDQVSWYFEFSMTDYPLMLGPGFISRLSQATITRVSICI
jgi:hypothetical protein